MIEPAMQQRPWSLPWLGIVAALAAASAFTNHFAIAAVVSATLVAMVGATSRRLASAMLAPAAPVSLHLAAVGLLGSVLASGSVAALGLCGVFRTPWVVVWVGSLFVIAQRCLPEPRRWLVLLNELPFGRGKSPWIVAAGLTFLVVWAFVLRNQVLFTPQDADSMWYHLPMAGEWVRTGSLQPVNAIPLIGIAYPGFRQALLAFVSLPFGNEHLALLAAFEMPMLALAVYVVARGWNARRSLAFSGAVHAAMTPVVLGAYTTQGNDVSLAIHLLFAFAFTRRLLMVGGVAAGGLAGLALGALASIKFSGPGYAGVVALVSAIELGVRRLRLGSAATTFGAAAAIAGPWYLRNLVYFGNPLHPAEVRVAGNVLFPGPLTKDYFAPTTLGFNLRPLVTEAHQFVQAHGWTITVIGLAPLLILLATLRTPGQRRTGIAVALACVLLFVAFLHHPFNDPTYGFDASYVMRYLIAWACVSTAAAMAALSRFGPWWLWAAALLTVPWLGVYQLTHFVVPMLAAVVAGTAVVALAAAQRRITAVYERVGARRFPLFVWLLLFAGAAFGLQGLRSKLQYDPAVGFHDSVSDRGWGGCVAWIHENVHEKRVGLHGSIYFFPLLGEPFANEVFVADDLHLDVPRRTVEQVAAWVKEQRLDYLVCCVPRVERRGSKDYVFGESYAEALLRQFPQQFARVFADRGAAVLKVTSGDKR